MVLKPFLVAKTNGGEISLIERLRLLKSWGVEVSVHIALSDAERNYSTSYLRDLGTPLRENFYEVDGIPCFIHFGPQFSAENLSFQLPMELFFLDLLSREKPDFVWTHFTDFFATTAALQWNPARIWVDLTDNEFPRMEKLESVPSVAKYYRSIQTIMVASSFMKTKSKESLSWAEPILLPNIIEFLKEKPVVRSPEAWVFVNPTYVKGVDFVMDLAHRLPQEKFLFVGNWLGDRPVLMPSNVAFVSRQNSLREIFRRARGLLMPSVWDEAFGRVPLEAMAAGVPVISSNRGALPQTIGAGGLVLPLEAKLWVEAMREPETFWSGYLKKGFERIAEYQSQTAEAYADLKHRLQKFL